MRFTSSIVSALVFIAASSSIEASQEVAAVASFPSVELPDQDRPSEAERGGGFRENTEHIGAASDSFVDPLERICGPDVTSVALWEPGEDEQVVLGICEHHRDLRMGAIKHAPDFVELGRQMLGVPLDEDRSDNRGNHVLGAFRHDAEHVAHEVDPATLPPHGLENGADRFLQSAVGVGHDKVDPAGHGDGVPDQQETEVTDDWHGCGVSASAVVDDSKNGARVHARESRSAGPESAESSAVP